MTARPEPTEAQFQATIVELAELCGWRTNHDPPTDHHVTTGRLGLARARASLPSATP